MEIQYPKTVTAEARFIRCTLPIRHQEEIDAMGPGFPGLVGMVLDITLDIDTRSVVDWPAGRVSEVFIDVCDKGIYVLLDGDGIPIAHRRDCRVLRCLPRECNADFIARIGADGVVEGWRPTAAEVVDSFWPA